ESEYFLKNQQYSYLDFRKGFAQVFQDPLDSIEDFPIQVA
ncbi:unnamed protein product, partial [Rotaria sp. Silwood2]